MVDAQRQGSTEAEVQAGKGEARESSEGQRANSQQREQREAHEEQGQVDVLCATFAM